MKKELYEKPKMVIETIDLATLAGQYGGTQPSPSGITQPALGSCCVPEGPGPG
jgi:hypothetical protein